MLDKLLQTQDNVRDSENQKTKNYLIYEGQNRGRTHLDWLDSHHTFSFGHFQNPNRIGFHSLLVINDDKIVPGAGFPPQEHNDIVIITYVLKGELEHKDSLGNRTTLKPGTVQVMSTGTGIIHSKSNLSKIESVHFLQFWIAPKKKGLNPQCQQQTFTFEERRRKLALIATADESNEVATLHQDVNLYTSILELGDTITHNVKPNRYAWLQVAQGVATLNGEIVKAGDGVQIYGGEQLKISSDIAAEILLFDLG